MLERLKSLVKEMDEVVDELIKASSNKEGNDVPTQLDQQAAEPAPSVDNNNSEVSALPAYDFDTSWNYGHWLEAKTYDDIKAAMVEAQRNSRPILIALSKPTGCTNCLNYWRNVACDGVLNHDKNCGVASKKHPIVDFAKEHKVVMLYVSPSKLPNIASKIMGKEYDAYLHKPTYYPIYLVVSVKKGIDLNKVAANDKILNAGSDAGDTVDFIMGYIGIGGKPVYDYKGNKTVLTVKADSTGWSSFKSNMESIFADTSKTHGIVL